MNLVSDEGLKRYIIFNGNHSVTHQRPMVSSIVWDTSTRYFEQDKQDKRGWAVCEILTNVTIRGDEGRFLLTGFADF